MVVVKHPLVDGRKAGEQDIANSAEQLRNELQSRRPGEWRYLRPAEREQLITAGNRCENWENLQVTDRFDASLIRGTSFSGVVRIGALERGLLEAGECRIDIGISGSRIHSCDIGDHAAIHNVRLLSRYVIGHRNILFNIDEMTVGESARFGCGMSIEGVTESAIKSIALMNENGNRTILAFEGMLPADAFLWARYREDRVLRQKLTAMTAERADMRPGRFGSTGDGCVIRSARIITDIRIGSHAEIAGADLLENLTIGSTEKEPTSIGTGVVLRDGIVAPGCRIAGAGSMTGFVLGSAVTISDGARIFHSVIGDNSTISCCEVRHALIFPAHEQHHNTSFLIAALIQGQSNIAAGAIIGSNHNSRAADGEIVAGRGFWPGLCVSLKHSSRFASFTMVAKGDYPAEIDLRFPFSLLSNDPQRGRLVVAPAWWWLHNMYALARNDGKFRSRDKRVDKLQNIEFDSLAPDTVEEIFAAMRLLEIWTACAQPPTAKNGVENPDAAVLARRGRELLMSEGTDGAQTELTARGVEKSDRPVVIVKPRAAYRAYREMLLLYAVRNLTGWLAADPEVNPGSMATELGGNRITAWINMGGQLIPEADLDRLRERIRDGKIAGWQRVHEWYSRRWSAYPLEKLRHAYATLLALYSVDTLTRVHWIDALERAETIQDFVATQTAATREKDFDNRFRKATFRNDAEMMAVTGTVADDAFVKQIREETAAFHRQINSVRDRW